MLNTLQIAQAINKIAVANDESSIPVMFICFDN